MKKILYTFLALSFLGCNNDDKLSDESVIIRNGEESQSLNPQNDLDKYLDETFAKPYNIQILYRFLEREISRIYTYTPTKYNKAIEFANVFNYLFIEPYVKLTSKPFMKEHSFNTLILIGEPASDYKNDRWVNEWNLNTKNYLRAGFITAYSSFDHDEDFVELLARYIVYYNASLDCNCATTNSSLDTNGDGFDDTLYNAWKAKFSNYGSTLSEYYTPYESTSVWEEVLKKADRKIRPTETYTGKQKIEQKIAIMKKYLQDEWNINLDELRAEIRSRYPYVAGKTFDGVPIQRKDFTRLTR